jgi:hypothetical protein
VLEALRARGDVVVAGRLADIDKAIEANDYRIANIRAGYAYVISNIGAFGPNIVKIGMTRRLVPMDRVRELGDASVPFRYDVHAMFLSDDAITLENELHKRFADRRVNFVNESREFFFATPAEVRVALLEKDGGLLEFHESPEAQSAARKTAGTATRPRLRSKNLGCDSGVGTQGVLNPVAGQPEFRGDHVDRFPGPE